MLTILINWWERVSIIEISHLLLANLTNWLKIKLIMKYSELYSMLDIDSVWNLINTVKVTKLLIRNKRTPQISLIKYGWIQNVSFTNY